MRLIVVGGLLLVGCADRGSVPAAPAPTQSAEPVPPPRTAPPRDAILITSSQAPPVEAPPTAPAIVVPEDLKAAPRWIARRVSTGLVLPNHSMDTYKLQRVGTRALLTVDEQKATEMGGGKLGKLAWGTPSTKVYVGTVDANLNVQPTDGGTALAMPCELRKLKVARPTAKRVATPRKAGTEDCGDVGRWSPATTSTVDALVCKDRYGGELAFAAAPGVEYTFVNNDCLQGGGWRAIAKDGAYAPAY